MNKNLRWMSVLGLTAAMVGMATAFPPPADAPAGKTAKSTVKIGEAVADFNLVDSKGQAHKLSDQKGKIVVLEWINPRCPYVVGVYKNNTMQNTYEELKKLDSNIVYMAVNTTFDTTADENNEWISQYNLGYPILLDNTDGKVGRMFDARTTPHMFVIDGEGVLRYHGAITDNAKGNKNADETTNYVINAVKQIKSGETVSPDHVKSWGCSVKWPGGGKN